MRSVLYASGRTERIPEWRARVLQYLDTMVDSSRRAMAYHEVLDCQLKGFVYLRIYKSEPSAFIKDLPLST